MRVKRGKFDKILNNLCLIFLIGISIFILGIWCEIPDKVPMHYDSVGNVTRWGSKLQLIILPIIAWIMYAFCTLIERIPDEWNTLVKVTEKNKEQVYLTLLHFISTIKFIFVCSFSYIILQSALVWKLSKWFVTIELFAIFSSIIYFGYQLFIHK